jgi:hypothetical protein
VDGDSIPSVAARSGHFWQTIWDDPANEPLKAARRNPNVLAIGDIVNVPELRIEPRTCGTGKRHVFQRRGIPSLLRVQLREQGQARAGLLYRIALDSGEVIDGTTDDKGVLEVPLSPTSRRAALAVDGEPVTWILDIGALQPADSATGIRQRLINIGMVAEDDDTLASSLTCSILENGTDELRHDHDEVSTPGGSAENG